MWNSCVSLNYNNKTFSGLNFIVFYFVISSFVDRGKGGVNWVRVLKWFWLQKKDSLWMHKSENAIFHRNIFDICCGCRENVWAGSLCLSVILKCC